MIDSRLWLPLVTVGVVLAKSTHFLVGVAQHCEQKNRGQVPAPTLTAMPPTNSVNVFFSRRAKPDTAAKSRRNPEMKQHKPVGGEGRFPTRDGF